MAQFKTDYDLWKEIEAGQAQQKVISGLDADKDKGVHSLNMADGDQDAAKYIYSNYDTASRAYRSNLAQDVVAGDPLLQAYFNKNPMASIVSRDDVSRLSEYSEKLNLLDDVFATPAAVKAAKDLYDAFKLDPWGAASAGTRAGLHAVLPTAAGVATIPAGVAAGGAVGALGGPLAPVTVPVGAFVGALAAALAAGAAVQYGQTKLLEATFPDELERLEEARKEHPWATALAEVAPSLAFFSPGSLASTSLKLRGGLAGVGLGIEAVNQLMSNDELDPGHLLIATGAGFLLAGEPTRYGSALMSPMQKWANAFTTSAFLIRHTKDGEVPPLGVNPVWDKFVADNVKADMDVYDEAMDAAHKTETKELTPKMFSDLTGMKIDSQIGLKREAIIKLYGDKRPEPGDGLLGDIPGFPEQWDAILRGREPRVDFKDWVTVDKEIADQLHDDVRVRPDDSMTINESKEVPDPEKIWDLADETLDARFEDEQMLRDQRKAAGLDSVMEARTPKQLTLEDVGPAYPGDVEPHRARTFVMKDEYGKEVGSIQATMTPSKSLYISWIAGSGVAPKNMFGPTLIRGVLDQLKAMFPEMTHIEGHRISGAREKAGVEGPQALVKIDIDVLRAELDGKPTPAGEEAEIQKFVDMAQSGEYVDWGKGVQARTAPKTWGPVEIAFAKKLEDYLAKIIPQGGVRLIHARDVISGGRQVRGVHVNFGDRTPLILYSINYRDPMGSVAHEAFHFLLRQGFITEKEWFSLLNKAIEGNWIEKHKIDVRYKDAPPMVQAEEAIVHEFESWKRGREAPPEVTGIFGKLKQFFDGLRDLIDQHWGKRVQPDDIFQKVEAGTVGRRKPVRMEGRYYPPETKFKAEARFQDEVIPELGREPLTFEPGVLLAKRNYQKLLDAINRKNQKDVRTRLGNEQRKLERQLLPGWQKEAAELYVPVREDIEARPDFKAFKFMTQGIFQGNDMGGIPKIDPRSLTDVQKRMIPKHWQSEGGFRIDDIATTFGFRTNDEFASAMVDFRKVKGNKPYEKFLDELTRNVVKEKMEAKYGDMDKLTADEARRKVVGLEERDLVWSEYQVLADRTGQTIPYDREAVQAMAREEVAAGNTKQKLIDVTRDLGRAGRETHQAWQRGDHLAAFHARQKTVHLLAVAEETKRWEARKKADVRILERFSKAEVKGIDPEFQDWAHWLLQEAGVPIDRDPAHLAETMDRPERVYKTFADWVNSKNIPIDPAKPINVGLPIGYDEYGTTYNPNFPVWQFLLQPSFEFKLGTANVRDWKNFTNAIRVIAKVGQETGKDLVNIRDKDYKIADVVNELSVGLMRSDEVSQPRSKHDMKTRQIFRRMDAALTQVETFLDRLVGYDPTSAWHRLFYYPVSEADHDWQRMRRELAPKLREALKTPGGKLWYQQKVMNDTIRHPMHMLRDENGNPRIPFKDQDLLDLTNEDIVGLILHSGSPDSELHTANGYGLSIPDFRNYMLRVATPEHYRIAKNVAKLYEHVQGLEDNMSMKRTGAILEKLYPQMTWTAQGPQMGWYYPRQRDTYLDAGNRQITQDKAINVRPRLDHGWGEQRTGEIYPVKTKFGDGIGDDLNRRLRFVAFRPVLDIYNKVLAHPDISRLIQLRWGQQWNTMLERYFTDLSGMHGSTAKNDSWATHWFNQFSNNLVTDYIGFNFKTWEKHAPQSIYQSIKEVGGWNFVKAAFDLYKTNTYTMESNHKFMMEGGMIGNKEWHGAGEIQVRNEHWRTSLSAAADEELGRLTWLRKNVNNAAYWGAKHIAFVDTLMSKITWWARYREQMTKLSREYTEGKSLTPAEFNQAIWEAHQLASDLSSRSVRATHGSTAISGKPALLRSSNPMVQTVTRANNFMNNAMNRRFRSLGMAKDMLTGKSNRPLFKDMTTIGRDFFTYVVLPTLLEDLAEPICHEDEEWSTCAPKYLVQAVAAPIPIVRDFVHAFITGTPPTVGLTFGAMNFASRMFKDAEKTWEDETQFGSLVKNAMGLSGAILGYPGSVPGRWAEYMIKLYQGEEEKPDSLEEWERVATKGRTQKSRHEEDRESFLHRLYRGAVP